MQSAVAFPISPIPISPIGEPPSVFEAQLILDGVSRSFDQTLVLAAIDLHLGRGTICRVTGDNGSGKSTLLRVAGGLLPPSTGRRWAAGPALYLQPGDASRPGQTVRQAIQFVARQRTNPPTITEALTTVGLDKLADTQVSRLTSGQRTSLTLAIAAVYQPTVACLDEPTAHLDRDGRAAASKVIVGLAARGTAILVATHDDGFLADLADTSVRLKRGRLQANAGWAPPKSVAPRRRARQSWHLSTPSNAARATTSLRLVESVHAG